MKKYLLLSLCLFALASSLFSLDIPLSFGHGFEFFGNWTTASTSFEQVEDVMTINTNEKIEDLNYGVFYFLDATYAELFVSLYYGTNALESKRSASSQYPVPPQASGTSNFSKDNLSIAFGLLGKYPFHFGKFTISPLLGFSYQIFLRGDYGDEYSTVAIETKASDFNTLWLHAGANVNYDISDKLYIKFESLYGIKSAPSMYDLKNTAFIENIKADGKIKSGWVNTLTLRLGLGYRIR
jgi:hypothetical protein